jgi:hypothetical protein
MGCLVVLLALIGPRLALLAVWLFTSEVEMAFDGFAVPVLGFVFFPWTTLVYALAYGADGVSPIGWAFVALGLLADVSSIAASRKVRR